MLIEDAVGRSIEGLLAGEDLVADDGERVLIGPAIDLQPLGLLRRHVVRSPDDRAGPGELRSTLHRLRDAEVGKHHPTVFVQHDVGRLHVAVNDPALMGVAQRERGLPQHPASRVRSGVGPSSSTCFSDRPVTYFITK